MLFMHLIQSLKQQKLDIILKTLSEEIDPSDLRKILISGLIHTVQSTITINTLSTLNELIINIVFVNYKYIKRTYHKSTEN